MSMFLKKPSKGLSIRMADLPGAPKLKTTSFFNFDNVPAPDYWETSVDNSDLEGNDSGSDDVFSDGSTPPPTPALLDSESTESDIELSSEDSSSEEEESEEEESSEEESEEEETSDSSSTASGFSPGPEDDPDSQKLPANFGQMFQGLASELPLSSPEATQGVKRKTSDDIAEKSKKRPEIIIISSDDEDGNEDDVQFVRSYTKQGTPPLTGSNNYTWPWCE